VNDYIMEEDPFPILYIDESVAESQTASVQRLKQTRDNARVQKCLEDLRRAARGSRPSDNIMYPILDCARAYATLGEMCDALRDVWGEYQEPPTF
jgi:methylmalonyl-CoA mutase N-terminal domain/subunit